MKRNVGLWFGPLAAVLLLSGIVVLGMHVPGYSAVRQTVSEIGEIGSPQQRHFSAMLYAVAICLLVFAGAVHAYARDHQLSRWPPYLIGAMAVPVIGVAVFAFPHPLHGVFGLTELIAYPAPLVLAVTWKARNVRRAAGMSAIFGILVVLSVILNLSSLGHDGWLWDRIKDVYGLVQRSLFVCWFLWVMCLGLLLRNQRLTGRVLARI